MLLINDGMLTDRSSEDFLDLTEMLPHQELLKTSKLHKYKPGDGTLAP